MSTDGHWLATLIGVPSRGTRDVQNGLVLFCFPSFNYHVSHLGLLAPLHKLENVDSVPYTFA